MVSATDDVLKDNANYERMAEEMVQHVKDHVVAISAFYNGGLHQHATGTLVRFADHYFLITAAHAIEDYHKGLNVYADLQLYVDNGTANNLVPLFGRYHATETVRDRTQSRVRLKDERNDIWDIGLWELDHRTVKELTTKRFLNRHQISIAENHSEGVYFLAGCPQKWANIDSEARTAKWKWLRYIAHPYPEWKELPNYDERFHVAICLGDDPTLPEKFVGISGCPIWRLANLPVPDNWTPDQAMLVAVQTCVYNDRPLKAIRGTKWRCVVPVLADMHPQIREGFKLWLP